MRTPDHSTCKGNDSFNLPNSNQREEGVQALKEGPVAGEQAPEVGRRGPSKDSILVLFFPCNPHPFFPVVTHVLLTTHSQARFSLTHYCMCLYPMAPNIIFYDILFKELVFWIFLNTKKRSLFVFFIFPAIIKFRKPSLMQRFNKGRQTSERLQVRFQTTAIKRVSQ